MIWDIVLAALSFAAQAVITWIAWKATVKPIGPKETKRRRRYEAAILVCFLSGFASLVATSIRAGSIQTEMDELRKLQLEANHGIETIAKKPPDQITFEPFPAVAPLTSHLRVTSQGTPGYTEKFFVNVNLINEGTLPAYGFTHTIVEGKILPISEESEKLVWSEASDAAKKLAFGPDSAVVPTARTIYFSMLAKLSPKDIQDLHDEKKGLYFAAIGKYKDKQGHRQLEICESFHRDKSVVHYCNIGHNQ